MIADAKLPSAHGEQNRFVVGLPGVDAYCPARHVVRGPQTVAGLESLSQKFAPQVTEAAAPPAQYVPATHAVHTGGEAKVPAWV